ncbi:hypothetical protein SASPL_122644 [Salvia splendens]|uniref:Uncharacterized protein n=1 Tax=Salvia splendens TaxID=180675 RepID=A0A8X8XKB9_SALSN|nr:uncharacterized protein LOC121744036 [Salvia splendens]KAG6415238.1 hypothetical protein SASPL_122644 [Salvia splendens]
MLRGYCDNIFEEALPSHGLLSQRGKMQSRLALAVAKFNRTLFPQQSVRGCATTSGRTADPAIHAVEEEDVYPTDAMQDEKRRRPPKHDNETYTPPKSPTETAPKLESGGVGPMPDPFGQQKRQSWCAGIDGSPWPEEDGVDRKAQREEQERDNKEYYGHHKASPLSEIEVCDTRKPVTQATDGTAQSESVGYDGNLGERVWRPEQLDTAEEALRRAAEIFRMNAMRGDPDSPHGRVLRQLRGEDW